MNTVAQLLAVEKRKDTSDEKRVRTFPVVIATLNLLFCAYLDQYLRYDTDGHYFSTLLFIESAMMTLIAIGTFSKNGSEILLKTAIFPVTRWSRLVFVVVSFVRKPAIVALWLTTTIFIAVFFYPSFSAMCLTFMLYVLLEVITLLVTGIVCLQLTRSSQPIAGVALVSLFVILVVLVSSIVFRSNFLLTSFPVLSWAVDGILAAKQSQTEVVMLNGSFLAGAFVLLLVLGKRFS